MWNGLIALLSAAFLWFYGVAYINTGDGYSFVCAIIASFIGGYFATAAIRGAR